MLLSKKMGIKCEKCRVIRSEAECDTHEYKGVEKRYTSYRDCTNFMRAEALEKRLEKRQEKHGNGTICPNCKDLKFDFEY